MNKEYTINYSFYNSENYSVFKTICTIYLCLSRYALRALIFYAKWSLSLASGRFPLTSGSLYSVSGNLYSARGSLYSVRMNLYSAIISLYSASGSLYSVSGNFPLARGSFDLITKFKNKYNSQYCLI